MSPSTPRVAGCHSGQNRAVVTTFEHGVDRTVYDEVMAHLRHGCSSLEFCAPEGAQLQQGYVTRVGSGSPGRGAV